MTFETIPSSIAALIAADATLSPLGVAIQADPFSDPQTAWSAIDAQLRATGVCIEIGFPWIAAPETNFGGVTHAEPACEVFVAEHTTIAHTPVKLSLVHQVVKVITKNPGLGGKPMRLRSAESVKTENGYVVHMLSFFIPLNIR